MKFVKYIMAVIILAGGFAIAEPPPVQKASSEDDIKAALGGGVPMGRWNEGLLFDGIKPMPWLKSAANWFPRTEDIQPNEMRVTFMGTSPSIRPGQMNTSIFVELGNGDNFVPTYLLRSGNLKMLGENPEDARHDTF